MIVPMNVMINPISAGTITQDVLSCGLNSTRTVMPFAWLNAPTALCAVKSDEPSMSATGGPFPVTATTSVRLLRRSSTAWALVPVGSIAVMWNGPPTWVESCCACGPNSSVSIVLTVKLAA